jgi:hypothetical protein
MSVNLLNKCYLYSKAILVVYLTDFVKSDQMSWEGDTDTVNVSNVSGVQKQEIKHLKPLLKNEPTKRSKNN